MHRLLLTISVFFWLCASDLFSQTDNIAVNFLNTTNNFITLTSTEGFDFTGAMAVEAWIKVDHFDKPYTAIVTKGSTGWGLERWGSTNFLQFRAGDDSVQGSINVNDGLWHHVAGIYSNVLGIALVVDGVVDASKFLTLPTTPFNEYPVMIGDNAEKPGRFFYGRMDEVRIWYYYRTPQQIRDYMNVELVGNEPSLMAYYRMDHVFYYPSHIADYTGNEHTGILDNTAGNYQVWSDVIFEHAPSEGDGSTENPYQIDSIAELFWMTRHTDAWDKNFLQTGNIDATDTESLYGGQGMIPVGNATTKFTGNYDGGDFTIDGLFINRPDEDYAGMFGYVYHSDLSNIRLTNADITSQNWVGGIAGLLSYYSTITKSALSGNVTGTDKVGGMAGQANYSSSVLMCVNTGTISGENQVGGIAGDTWSSVSVNRCYNTGTIAGTGTDCGGISGYNHSNSNLINSYNSGVVSGNTAAGGIAGNSSAFIEKCYSTGAVSASALSGGLLGTGFGTVFNSFWDTETSGQGSSYGGTGKTTAQMKNIDTYTLVNEVDLWTAWDFVTNPNDDATTPGYWNIDPLGTINSGYPVLSWQAPVATAPSGSGTSGDPYLIGNLNNLVWMSENADVWDKYFEQIIDIPAGDTWSWNDLAGFLPVGNNTASFTGNYDGRHFAISDLFIKRNTTQLIGFFAAIDGATVSNMSITDADVAGLYFVGCLSGVATHSEISNCRVTGQVTGGSRVGGLSGTSTACTIQKCFADVKVTGVLPGYLPEKIGGLIGLVESASEINDCYSLGDVYGRFMVGGFTGQIAGSTVTHSYSKGAVTGSGIDMGGFIGYNNAATINNSFWDIETSGYATSGGGTGKTTAEMNEAGTFLAAGWEFEISDDTWAINNLANNGYPFLRMQEYTPADLWIGSTSADWAAAENWSEAETPTADVIIPATSAKNADPVIGISGTANCTSLTVESGASLTVLSDASGTGSLITTGQIVNNGTIEIQRYITDNAWHLIAVPNTTTTAGLFMGDYLQTWSETSAVWTDIVDPATQIFPAKGYGLWSMAGKATTFSYIGTPNTGNQSLAFTAEKQYGWNLAGNPYPSCLDWDLVIGGQTGLNNAVYCFDPTLGNDGQYVAYAGGVGDCRYLPPGQGFFISATASGTFTLTNDHRTHTGSSAFYKEKEIPDKYLRMDLFSDDRLADKLHLQLHNLATPGFDGDFDAVKISSNSTAKIYTLAGNEKLCIDRRPECPEVQLGFSSSAAGFYSIEANEINDFDRVFLEDTKTGIFHNLQNGAYEFAWEVTENETRFKLHLNAVGIEENQISESNILIYTANGQIFIKGAAAGQVKVCDLMGRIVHEQEITGKDLVSIPVNLKTGVYLVMVFNGKNFKTGKIFIK